MSTDYMQTPEEMAKHPDVPAFFAQVANGRPEVANALWSFWNFAHCFDDLIDGSGWPQSKKEQAMKALHDFTQDLLLNPFVRENAAALNVMFVSAMTRCLDGDAWAASDDPEKKALAPAVRCGDVDVLMAMVYLARGWDTLRQYSQKREYDK